MRKRVLSQYISKQVRNSAIFIDQSNYSAELTKEVMTKGGLLPDFCRFGFGRQIWLINLTVVEILF